MQNINKNLIFQQSLDLVSTNDIKNIFFSSGVSYNVMLSRLSVLNYVNYTVSLSRDKNISYQLTWIFLDILI